MITPTWEELFSGLDEGVLPERSYPYSYQDLPLIKLFVYSRIKGISGFQSLQKHLEVRSDVLNFVGLDKVPHRKTIAKRFRALPDSVLGLLHQLTEHFTLTEEVDASIASVDSTLMHAKGNVWHKKQRDKGELPSCGNVDREAHWGKSGCGEWVFGYRLHSLTLCGPEGITWPADISVQPANIKDADVFDDELAHCLPNDTEVLLGDGGYDQESCYRNCDERKVTLLAPIKVKKTRHPSVVKELSFTKTPVSARSLLYAKPPSNRFRVNSKTFSIWSTCP
jgi:IS5 family transposase